MFWALSSINSTLHNYTVHVCPLYRLLWAPAPGKLALYPSTVQRLLTTQRPVTSDVEDLHEIMQEEPVAMEILQQDNHLMEVKELQQRCVAQNVFV